ncbi:family with sequence similarity 166 member B [Schistosoma japonicum]|nr:family with sequence similarity 166 member B [Schistosoma japonicum]
MTSIEYGGGPSLRQRQEFANLESGGHVPGYMGFCPQFKYRYGHTFGKETAGIAKDLPYYFGPHSQKPYHFYSTDYDDISRRMLPKSTGDNKYTEGMIPGYSGDVPHMNFKYGGTYRSLSDECVDQLVREYKCAEMKQNKLKEAACQFPKLHPLEKDPLVKNHLNTWTDDMIRMNSAFNTIRSPTEAPIPGYKGFIPRIDTTETGLAKRYHEAAQSSLETFRSECKNHFDNMDMPMTRLNTSSQQFSTMPITPNSKYYSARIFRQEGMIPDYEGHIHGYKYHVGKNFGNTTRDLEVCAHPYSSYGEYTKIRDSSLS